MFVNWILEKRQQNNDFSSKNYVSRRRLFQNWWLYKQANLQNMEGGQSIVYNESD